jgi:hypothetical protein
VHTEGVAEIHSLPARENFVDDRGVGFRATWHPDEGVFVLSIWHDDQCTGSFRLPIGEAAHLAGLLGANVSERAMNLEQAAPARPKVVNGD